MEGGEFRIIRRAQQEQSPWRGHIVPAHYGYHEQPQPGDRRDAVRQLIAKYRLLRTLNRFEARNLETSKSVFGRLPVGSMGDLYEPKMMLRDDERAQCAAKMIHQRGHHATEPF
jgi:hypothetical protein